MLYCKVDLWAAEVRGGPMSWKRPQSICFLRLRFTAYRKSIAVSSSREEFLLFQLTSQPETEWKEEVGRKGVSCCGWAKRIQPRAANRREPHHVQSSFHTCVEAKYRVKAEYEKSEMPCTRRTPKPWLLPILTVCLALGKSQFFVREQQENGQKRGSAFAKFALLFLWSEAR